MAQNNDTRQEAVWAKVNAARLSVLSNTALLVLKLIVGIHIGSIAVLSEAIHSAIDLVASMIAFFAVRAADAPPDKDHPFGHGKIESLSGTHRKEPTWWPERRVHRMMDDMPTAVRAAKSAPPPQPRPPVQPVRLQY